MKTSARALGYVLAKYVRIAKPRGVLLQRDAFDDSAAAVVGSTASQGLILCYWIEDAFLLILADAWLRSRSPQGLPNLGVVCDDTWSGSVVSSLLTLLGRKTTTLRWRNASHRLTDLQSIIRNRSSIGIAVDGHGPYGRVGANFCRLADRCSASIVPIAVRAHRCLTPGIRARIAIPPPGARLAVVVGEPISARSGDSLRPELVEARLWEARRTAAELAVSQAGLAPERAG